MIKYYKLLDTLNRRSMTKEDLRQQIGISSATMSKISVHKAVSLDVIDKICHALNCQPGDIMEYVPAAGQQPMQPNPVQAAEAPSTKQGKRYKPFTEEEAQRIDLPSLLTNLHYQISIAETYGPDVFSGLVARAKQAEPYNADSTDKHTTDNAAAAYNKNTDAAASDAPSYETLDEKLARLHKNHPRPKPIRTEI